MRFLVFLLFLSYTQSGFAVLSPLAQSIREMQQLVQSREIQKIPNSEVIEEIVRTDTGFVILTENYQIVVDRTYRDRSFLGPKQVELYFHTPEEL